MMGDTKLSEIRAELKQRLAESGLDLTWFDEQIRLLQQGPRPSERELETMRMLQKVVSEAVREKKRPTTGKKKTRSAS